MDFREDLHKSSRVELQAALDLPDSSAPKRWRLSRHLPPAVVSTFGFAGFMTCGGAVIAAATLAALHIH